MKYKNHLIQRQNLKGRLPFYTVQGDLLCQSFATKEMAKLNIEMRISYIVRCLDSIKYGASQIRFYQHEEKNGLIHRCRASGRFHFGHVKAAGFAEYLGTLSFEEALVELNTYAAGV